jgi:hypothetical protein
MRVGRGKQSGLQLSVEGSGRPFPEVISALPNVDGPMAPDEEDGGVQVLKRDKKSASTKDDFESSEPRRRNVEDFPQPDSTVEHLIFDPTNEYLVPTVVTKKRSTRPSNESIAQPKGTLIERHIGAASSASFPGRQDVNDSNTILSNSQRTRSDSRQAALTSSAGLLSQISKTFSDAMNALTSKRGSAIPSELRHSDTANTPTEQKCTQPSQKTKVPAAKSTQSPLANNSAQIAKGRASWQDDAGSSTQRQDSARGKRMAAPQGSRSKHAPVDLPRDPSTSDEGRPKRQPPTRKAAAILEEYVFEPLSKGRRGPPKAKDQGKQATSTAEVQGSSNNQPPQSAKKEAGSHNETQRQRVATSGKANNKAQVFAQDPSEHTSKHASATAIDNSHPSKVGQPQPSAKKRSDKVPSLRSDELTQPSTSEHGGQANKVTATVDKPAKKRATHDIDTQIEAARSESVASTTERRAKKRATRDVGSELASTKEESKLPQAGRQGATKPRPSSRSKEAGVIDRFSSQRMWTDDAEISEVETHEEEPAHTHHGGISSAQAGNKGRKTAHMVQSNRQAAGSKSVKEASQLPESKEAGKGAAASKTSHKNASEASRSTETTRSKPTHVVGQEVPQIQESSHGASGSKAARNAQDAAKSKEAAAQATEAKAGKDIQKVLLGKCRAQVYKLEKILPYGIMQVGTGVCVQVHACMQYVRIKVSFAASLRLWLPRTACIFVRFEDRYTYSCKNFYVRVFRLLPVRCVVKLWCWLNEGRVI